jgi:hypothetical protein
MSDKTTEQPFDVALCEHARYAAQRARKRLGGPLTADNLQLFLADRECIRYPTTIVYDRSGLEPHQFAQPLYIASKEGLGCELHVDPKLKQMADRLYLVVAYMAAVINYAEAATPDLAEMAGALLTGMHQEAFYEKICEIADSIK